MIKNRLTCRHSVPHLGYSAQIIGADYIWLELTPRSAAELVEARERGVSPIGFWLDDLVMILLAGSDEAVTKP